MSLFTDCQLSSEDCGGGLGRCDDIGDEEYILDSRKGSSMSVILYQHQVNGGRSLA